MNQGGNNNQNNQLDTHSEFSSKTNNSYINIINIEYLLLSKMFVIVVT